MRTIIDRLSRARCDLLVAHIDGPRHAFTIESSCREGLLKINLLRSCDECGTDRPNPNKISHTMITDKGRDVLASILAEYAEILIRAGCLEPEAVPVTLIPFAVETVETRRDRGVITRSLVVKERTAP